MVREGVLLCHWNGRFGNRMHQYAYIMEYSRNAGVEALLPSPWEGSRLFANHSAKVLEDDVLRLYLNQSQPAFDNLAARTAAIANYNARVGAAFEYLNPDDSLQTWCGKRAVYIDSVCAYNAAIFAQLSRTRLRNDVFVFSDEVRQTDAFKLFSDRAGTYDIAHLRRDDLARLSTARRHGPRHCLLSVESYQRAFQEYGFDPESIVWVSDDYEGRWHKNRQSSPRGSWSYPIGSDYIGPRAIFDWLPDFLQLYFARTVFRAPSSFSWWACCLSPTARVFSPDLSKGAVRVEDGLETVDCDFVAGNEPHWLNGGPEIRLREDCDEPARVRSSLMR